MIVAIIKTAFNQVGGENMIEMNDELIIAMRRFKEEFGDIVPVREMPANVTNENLIYAINDSIEQKTNILPERLGYNSLEKNKNILM